MSTVLWVMIRLKYKTDTFHISLTNTRKRNIYEQCKVTIDLRYILMRIKTSDSVY